MNDSLNYCPIRLLSGDCLDESCGRVYVEDAAGEIYEVITGVQDSYRSVLVPGYTIVLRFVASFNHRRSATTYQVTGATTYGTTD